MSAGQNVALIRAWVDAVNRNDVEAELACWQPDGQFTIISTGTTFNGIEQLRRGGQTSAAAIGAQPAEGRKRITNLFARRASSMTAAPRFRVRSSCTASR